MDRYSNSYGSFVDGQTAQIGLTGQGYAAEPMSARRSLGKELSHHVDLSQQLHDSIGQLFEALAPMLASEQDALASSGRLIEGAPHSEMVDRADAHSRSLQEAVERLQSLRSRIEL